MRKTWLSTILVLILAVSLAGCGSKENTASSNSKNTSAKPEAATTEPLTVKHARGEETFTETPKRVVVLEWSLAESVLSLGVQPVGVADIKGYHKWVKAGPDFNSDVVDVGTRQEPNLETISSLKPDLILTEDYRSDYDQLKAIAPTIVFNSQLEENQKSPYNYMVNSFQTIAKVLNKTKEGDAVLAHMKDSFDKAKQKLKDAGKEGASFVVTQAWSDQNAATMRLFTDNSMAAEVMKQIGLNNAFKPAKFQPDGFETVSVEALPQVQDANFFYVVQDDDNVFEKQLKDNAVWKGLKFVKEGRTYPLGGDMWLFGGPESAELLANKIVELLAK